MKTLFKKAILFSAAALLVIGGGYSWMWWKGGQSLRQSVEHVFSDLKSQKGWDVHYKNLSLEGYPFRLTLVFQGLSLKKMDLGERSLELSAPLRVSSTLGNPWKATLESRGTVTLKYRFFPGVSEDAFLTFSSQNIQGEIDLKESGLSRPAQFDFQDVVLHLPFMDCQAQTVRVENHGTALPIHIKTTVEARQISVKDREGKALFRSPFTGPFEHFSLTTSLQGPEKKAELPAPHSSQDEDTLGTFLSRGGGTFEVENAELRWGDMLFGASGTVALDEKRQPIASFVLSLTNFEDILDRLVANHVIKPQAALLAKITLFSLTEGPVQFPSGKREDAGKKEHRIPVTVQEGKFSLGPVTLFQIPPSVQDSFATFCNSLTFPPFEKKAGGSS